MSMSYNYTPEMRAADAEIAKTMGWTEVEMSPFGEWEGRTPSKSKWALIPRFHESHDARAALLEWLERQGNGYLKDEFIEHLAKIVGLSSLYQFDNFDLFKLMLATPAQVAEAALKVIQENDK